MREAGALENYTRAQAEFQRRARNAIALLPIKIQDSLLEWRPSVTASTELTVGV